MILRYLIKKRGFTTFVNWCLDSFLPPILRDSVFFKWFLMGLLGPSNPVFGFKSRVIHMNMEEFADQYKKIANMYTRKTDLNDPCLQEILHQTIGPKVLEVGAGSGYLSRYLVKKFDTTATEIGVLDHLKKISGLKIVSRAAEDLQFPDQSFNTVICTHVLEHVMDFDKALSELRRVAKRRLIIVVPLQRPYYITPDLHLHFFPYPELFIIRARPEQPYTVKVLRGDLYYEENYV